jgi:hypothetical protein
MTQLAYKRIAFPSKPKKQKLRLKWAKFLSIGAFCAISSMSPLTTANAQPKETAVSVEQKNTPHNDLSPQPWLGLIWLVIIGGIAWGFWKNRIPITKWGKEIKLKEVSEKVKAQIPKAHREALAECRMIMDIARKEGWAKPPESEVTRSRQMKYLDAKVMSAWDIALLGIGIGLDESAYSDGQNAEHRLYRLILNIASENGWRKENFPRFLENYRATRKKIQGKIPMGERNKLQYLKDMAGTIDSALHPSPPSRTGSAP